MPEQVKFAVQPREMTGKKVRQLRRRGILPGNIFGHNRESKAIQFDALEFSRFLKTHAGTTLLALTLDSGAAETAVVRHVERDPRTNVIQHVDFMHIEMSEPIKVAIPIHLEGVSPAVKNYDGMLLQLLETLEVEALPANLPEAVALDISDMTELKETRYVHHLRVPANVTVLTGTDEPVVKIEPPRIIVEEAVPAAAEAPALAAEEAPASAEAGEAGGEGSSGPA
ncbi:MAG TPA: 50S ribosomal protein L25 [Ktedonobacterales bacterium]|nr:50S ribosomal protein L25 [Ktedonobacterales bacterium]